MLDTIRRWMGATRRERELRALADDLHHECDRWAERVEADRRAHKAAMAALRKQLEDVIAERDEARRLLADAEAERDSWTQLLTAAEAERDESRETVQDVAANLRVLWEALEPDESQDDRTPPPAEEAKP